MVDGQKLCCKSDCRRRLNSRIGLYFSTNRPGENKQEGDEVPPSNEFISIRSVSNSICKIELARYCKELLTVLTRLYYPETSMCRLYPGSFDITKLSFDILIFYITVIVCLREVKRVVLLMISLLCALPALILCE